ncbi:MAG TPA: long-chain fatty acid--CoA ligase [Anaerolineae bacterium]|nr:long-chain fatty acid--CoA ligase [Anaerolineae bacterium]
MDKPWLKFYEESVPPSLEYSRIPLYQTLVNSAQKYPDNPAVKMVLRYLPLGLTIGARLNYRELDELTNRFANALRELGVSKGDRVAVMLPNCPQMVIAFYGALKLGAIVVSTNPMYTPREMKHQFVDSGAETAVLLNLFYPRMQQIWDETPVRQVIVTNIWDFVGFPFNRLVQRAQEKEGSHVEVTPTEGVYLFKQLLEVYPSTSPQVEVRADDIALFQYTGGTTGIPKAAMLSHFNLVANVLQVNAWMTSGEEGKERVMGALPFFHVYGMTVAMAYGIYLAGEVIVVPNPRPIDHVMEVIQKERVTIFPGVPAMYIGIINHPRVREYDLTSVKACISGAAPLPMEVQEKFGELTGGRLVEGYGLTEAAPVTHCNPIYGLRKAGSIGVPFPDVEARIVDYDTLEDKPIGEEGELWVRGPQVMPGYWQKPEETAKTKTEDGWLRTGDIARMDEDGYFYIVDRLKDIIIASGYNIVPREVEEVLYEHPKVQEAVVAGVPDAYRGETVKAYIVLKQGETATADEIRAFCRERLAAYKVPTQVEFRSELPKTLVGKFLRRVLVEEERKRKKLEQSEQAE